MSPLVEVLFVIGAIGSLATFGMVIFNIAKRIDAAIGVDSQGRSLSERMEKVEYQLWPNSGKSLADRVDKIEKSNSHMIAEIGIVKDLVNIIVESHLKTPRTRTTKK
jgi:hypothetical protein